MEKPIILFDGCCNLCSSSVQFIIERDKHNRFSFVSIQSDFGKELLRKCGVDSEKIGSLVLIDDNGCLTKSDAALAIAQKIGGPRHLLFALRLVPRLFRDWSYDWIARNRMRLRGGNRSCARR
jgi:predicted DCC family thiol-disulfide oxidoreductase YuxK